ncbi:MAG: GDSL-type esterase/lipase family protein [Patescibacteria group bacterium]|jgi:lysophospholipase L1-like esterase
MIKKILPTKRHFFWILVTVLLVISVLAEAPSYVNPKTALAYPDYPANSDKVLVAPYDTITTGAANWGCASGICSDTSTRDYITIGQKYRIRESGTVSRIRIYTVSTTGLAQFYVKIWRKDGATYDLVGASENLISSLSSGQYSTIDLASPIAGVQEGDYYGYQVILSTKGSFFYAKTSITGVTSYYHTNSAVATTDYNWEGSSEFLAGAVLPIEFYMQAPQVAFIGDSIIAGHPAHYSFLEATATTNIASTIESQFGVLTGYSYQNMGIGSQTTAQISARFAADIVALKPRAVVIEGGVNDIAGGVLKATFLANWTSMLDAAQAESSLDRIVVIKVLPWTNGTTTQMQTRDDWNASLTTLANNYSKAIVVDASSYVGQFRSGGDAGNLWDIQTAYNSDGVHYNTAGHGQIAQAIADIGFDSVAPVAFTPTSNPASWTSANSADISFSTTDAGSGVASYSIKLDSGAYTDSVSSPYTLNIAAVADGTHTVTVKAIDTAGNFREHTVSVYVDKSAPAGFTPVADPAATTNSDTISVSFSTSDAASDVANYKLKLDSGAYGSSITSPYTLDVSAVADGTHTVTIKATDNAGNIAEGVVSIYLDKTVAVLSGGSPSGTLDASTTSATLSVTTDSSSTCKYSTSAGTAYGVMTGSFTTSNGTSHTATVSGLADGNTYHYYVRCLDSAGNTNSSDYEISFSVDDSPAATPTPTSTPTSTPTTAATSTPTPTSTAEASSTPTATTSTTTNSTAATTRSTATPASTISASPSAAASPVASVSPTADTDSQFFDTQILMENGQKVIKTVKFKIVDADGKPISKLEVTIHSDPQTASTDEDGVVVYNNIPVGDHVLAFAYQGIGYEKSVAVADPAVNTGTYRAEIVVVKAAKDPLPLWAWIVYAFSACIIAILVYALFRLRRTRKLK